MPTMASVKLSALRPVVNHPHYEDAGLRYAVLTLKTTFMPIVRGQQSDTASGRLWWLALAEAEECWLDATLLVKREAPRAVQPGLWLTFSQALSKCPRVSQSGRGFQT